MAKKGFTTYEEAEEAARRHNEDTEKFNAYAFTADTGEYIRYKEVYHYRDPVSNVRKWFLRAIKGQPEATHIRVVRRK